MIIEMKMMLELKRMHEMNVVVKIKMIQVTDMILDDDDVQEFKTGGVNDALDEFEV